MNPDQLKTPTLTEAEKPPLEFSPETQALLEALSSDEQADHVVSMRSVLGGDGDEHHEEPTDDETVQDEDERSSSPADWSTVSVRQARQFLHDHPEAAIDVVFPTVYEEDRSAKLKDLGTAQALGAISHQRMAEGMAKELGIDPYNYEEEQDQIRDENPPIDPAKNLGSGDKVMQGMLGPLGGTPAQTPPGAAAGGADLGGGLPGKDTGAPPVGSGQPGGTASERQGPRDPMTRASMRDLQPGEPVRAELATLRQDERANARAELVEVDVEARVLARRREYERQLIEAKSQEERQQIKTQLDTLTSEFSKFRETLAKLSEIVVKPADVHIHNAAPIIEAQAPPVINVEAPVVNVAPAEVQVDVHMPKAGEQEVVVERDKQGLIKRATVRDKE